MMGSLTGMVLGLLIGFTCRYFSIPSPAPPKIMGALLVLAMTFGYVSAGWFFSVPLL